MEKSNPLVKLVSSIFLLDKDWVTRVTMAMIVLSLIWGILGIIDALMVRIEEASWALFQYLPLSPQEYEGSITLHGIRDLFGFAQQLIFAVFFYFTFKMLKVEPRAKWFFNIGFILFNISFMLFEGPIILTNQPGFDNYFGATGWYYLAPLGLPGYSLYVASSTWYWAWMLMDIGTYMTSGYLIYHFYQATKTMKEKLPVFLTYGLMIMLLIQIGYAGEVVANVWDLTTFYGITGMDVIANQVAFGDLWHAIVYITWFPAVASLYLLIPTLSGKPLYSERAGRLSALLYLVFSAGGIGIHHIYMADLPLALKLVVEAITLGVVIPTMMTFFNLWATVKGSTIKLNIIALWTATAWAGSIAGGVLGIFNSILADDAVEHETEFIVSHFHQMIYWAIVPAGFAVLYYMIPMMTGRMWYSNKTAWIHYAGYMLGTVMIIVGFSMVGIGGLVRKELIFPLIPVYIFGEVLSTVGAVIADVATIGWLINLVLTLVKGKPVELEGQELPQVINTVAMSFKAPDKIDMRQLVSSPANLVKKLNIHFIHSKKQDA
ncbi:cbb3-type cytochrome c oxidase subunit I [Sulfuracidifex metallicus]|uniref:Oxidase n=2 Tax=Sulfuracidifex metallicus TaxID=47303 RepID=A0A6A9QL66_SULME|nr:cbb3-type cytochrome c oxidase subunit I [Sulfuracidifex metallicus]MUN28428.1 oxidase [Sulfuracidifex metallicus DSM 6482 = JCM 9184]WOE51055.1 cbb3-type cytochrome c oxidase subunit I [Sulfuracidifex metallicus DSM 6482 = JCM 9184]